MKHLKLILLTLFLFVGMSATSQTVKVRYFNAEWNEANQCNWIKDIVNAKSYRIDLESQTAKDYKIKVLPTLIVFNDGEEIKRFEGNISFKICPKRTPKKVQKVVNNLIANKL